jgi:hypothetical protein
VNDYKLIDAILTAVKLLSVHRRRDLIDKLLEENAEEEFAPMSPPKFSTWIM